ncbi:hypothetical protein WJX81_005553 [Elliptochloris bilobata]|uniref:Uncharacterized protein n=1 Tax=Elliptochloris bilobata TaxID=381761 RepID=A0AAW1REK5_9CHLO
MGQQQRYTVIARHRNSLHTATRPRQRRRCSPVQAFLVPDISVGPHEPPEFAAMARKAVSMMSLEEVIGRAVLEVVTVWTVSCMIRAVVHKFGEEARKRYEGDKDPRHAVRILFDSAVASVANPARSLLPLASAIWSLRTVVLTLQIFLDPKLGFLGTMLEKQSHKHMARQACHHTLRQLLNADNILLSLWQVSAIVFTIWYLLCWKNRLVDIFMRIQSDRQDSGEGSLGLERVIIPVSGLADWGLIAVGVLTGLHAFGLNIQPLLAVGGVSGVAIGFGAQNLTSNAISGLILFLTRPFVVGDRVELKSSGGGTIVMGVVESISMMRTQLRTDRAVPISIPNRAITDMIVSNESHIKTPSASIAAPRQFTKTLTMRPTNLDEVRAVKDAISEHLMNRAGIDHSLPRGCELDTIDDGTVKLSITAHATPAQARDFSRFQEQLQLETADILSRHLAAKK